jgi:hypothetical protein
VAENSQVARFLPAIHDGCELGDFDTSVDGSSLW